MNTLTVEPTGSKDFGPCECCGSMSRTVWGFVHRDGTTLAAYFVQWTPGRLDHYPNFDLILGKWGDGTAASDRRAVSLAYRLADDGPSFMVVDANARPVAGNELVGRALRREEVVGSPLAGEAFAVVDALLAHDARIAELLGPWKLN